MLYFQNGVISRRRLHFGTVRITAVRCTNVNATWFAIGSTSAVSRKNLDVPYAIALSLRKLTLRGMWLWNIKWYRRTRNFQPIVLYYKYIGLKMFITRIEWDFMRELYRYPYLGAMYDYKLFIILHLIKVFHSFVRILSIKSSYYTTSGFYGLILRNILAHN